MSHDVIVFGMFYVNLIQDLDRFGMGGWLKESKAEPDLRPRYIMS